MVVCTHQYLGHSSDSLPISEASNDFKNGRKRASRVQELSKAIGTKSETLVTCLRNKSQNFGEKSNAAYVDRIDLGRKTQGIIANAFRYTKIRFSACFSQALRTERCILVGSDCKFCIADTECEG